MRSAEAGLRFVVRRSTSASGCVKEQSLEVDAREALLGSAAHCEVRLASGEVAQEQLLVRVDEHDEGLVVFGLAREPPILVDGAPLREGPLAAGAIVCIGNYRVRIELSGPAVESPERLRKRHRIQLAVVAGMCAFVTTVALLDAPDSRASASMPVPPELWPEGAPPRCAETAAARAGALARQELARALVKRERAPYSVRDTLGALVALRAARSCFAAASDVANAERSGALFDELLHRTAAEYQRHLVSLERALQSRRWDTVQREASFLAQLLSDRASSYVDWLSRVRRLALRQLAQAAAK